MKDSDKEGLLHINVNDVAPTLSYAGSPFTYTKNTAISTLTPTNTGGAIISCSSSPNLPAGLSTEVKARTVNGDISTEFPLTVVGRFSRKQLDGSIGGGGRTLELHTVNGGIALRQR